MTFPLHWSAGIHHDGSAMYVSNPLPKLGETVRIQLRVPKNAPIRSVVLRSVPDGEPHYEVMTEQGHDEVSKWLGADLYVRMPSNPYRFRIITDEGAFFLTARGLSRAEWPDWSDFKLLADFTAPAWIDDTVFYQIFPDRFRNGDPSLNVKPNEWYKGRFGTQLRPWGAPPLHYREGGNVDFHGGDLPGIAQKIDYLRDLGVNALYLTPIFSARTNHRYDIMDFFHVDEHLGGNEALEALRTALDRAGMRIMLDVTLNHCGSEHPWFKSAQFDINNPTAEFYTFHNHPNDYEAWLGIRSLAKFNYRSERLRETLYRGPDSVLRTWLRAPYRIDGWRLDVANMQARQGAIQLAHKVGRQIRRAVKGDNPNAYILGEHFYDGTPHLQGDELDATMNYSGFTLPLWRWLAGYEFGVDRGRPGVDDKLLSSEALFEQWAAYYGAVPWVIARQQFNLLDSHDTWRILNICKGDKALVKVAAALLLTYPGVASVYYGDEVGLGGGGDPDNRACMLWDEQTWDQDLRQHYQVLIKLRRTAPALVRGGYQALVARDGLIAYQRHDHVQRLVVIAYRGPEPAVDVSIPVWHGGLRDGLVLKDLLGKGTFSVKDGNIKLGDLTKGSIYVLEG